MIKKISLTLIALTIAATAYAKPPKWTQKVHWEEGVYHYFVGTSSKASTEEIGRREAYDNAMAEALQSLIGVSGRMDLATYANLQKIQISQDVFIATDEVKLPVETVDIYVEKAKEKGDTVYNVWRSIKVKQSDADAEVDRLKKLALAKKQESAPRVVDAGDGLVAVFADGTAVIVREDEPSAKAAAIQNGIKRSCERLIKEWFYSDVIEQNYGKFNSVIYNRCSSYAKNYEVLSGGAENNVYKANLKVYLKTSEIDRRLKDVGLYRKQLGDVKAPDIAPNFNESAVPAPPTEMQNSDAKK